MTKKFSELFAPLFPAPKEKTMEATQKLYGPNWQLRQAEEDEKEVQRAKQEAATLINPVSGRSLPTQAQVFEQYEQFRAQFGEE